MRQAFLMAQLVAEPVLGYIHTFVAFPRWKHLGLKIAPVWMMIIQIFFTALCPSVVVFWESSFPQTAPLQLLAVPCFVQSCLWHNFSIPPGHDDVFFHYADEMSSLSRTLAATGEIAPRIPPFLQQFFLFDWITFQCQQYQWSLPTSTSVNVLMR